MENMQFVTCNHQTCPFNADRTCRARIIWVDEQGFCLGEDFKEHNDKSPTNQYVNVAECRNQACDNFDIDRASECGMCNLNSSLHFDSLEISDENKKPICHWFNNRVRPAPPSALL